MFIGWSSVEVMAQEADSVEARKALEVRGYVKDLQSQYLPEQLNFAIAYSGVKRYI
jgi:hypothetical protein